MRTSKYEIAVLPMPTLLLGMANAIDPFGSIGIQVHFDLPESVQEAIARDWEAVYGDVSLAFDRVAEGVAQP